jgi:hypothetical protein
MNPQHRQMNTSVNMGFHVPYSLFCVADMSKYYESETRKNESLPKMVSNWFRIHIFVCQHKWIRMTKKWIRKKKICSYPRPKFMNPRITMTLFVPYSFFWSGIHLCSLQTHSKIEIKRVSDMNPRQNKMYPRHEKMNPDVRNRLLGSGFWYFVPDSFKEGADSCILCESETQLYESETQ